LEGQEVSRKGRPQYSDPTQSSEGRKAGREAYKTVPRRGIYWEPITECLSPGVRRRPRKKRLRKRYTSTYKRGGEAIFPIPQPYQWNGKPIPKRISSRNCRNRNGAAMPNIRGCKIWGRVLVIGGQEK